MKANYYHPTRGFAWSVHSGNCKQCANKANCGEKNKREAENCGKFRPMVSYKRRKKK